jgi:hypothetical protein
MRGDEGGLDAEIEIVSEAVRGAALSGACAVEVSVPLNLVTTLAWEELFAFGARCCEAAHAGRATVRFMFPASRAGVGTLRAAARAGAVLLQVSQAMCLQRICL